MNSHLSAPAARPSLNTATARARSPTSPERFGDVSIDHGRGTWPGLKIRHAQRPLGAAETPFSGSAVAVQYLVAGQRAVSQRKRPAVEAECCASIGRARRIARPLSLRGLSRLSGRRLRRLALPLSGRKRLRRLSPSIATRRDRDDALERMQSCRNDGLRISRPCPILQHNWPVDRPPRRASLSGGALQWRT